MACAPCRRQLQPKVCFTVNGLALSAVPMGNTVLAIWTLFSVHHRRASCHPSPGFHQPPRLARNAYALGAVFLWDPSPRHCSRELAPSTYLRMSGSDTPWLQEYERSTTEASRYACPGSSILRALHVHTLLALVFFSLPAYILTTFPIDDYRTRVEWNHIH